MDKITRIHGDPGEGQHAGPQARKQILVSDRYKKIDAGDIFEIYTWKKVSGQWVSVCRCVKSQTWYYIDDTLFDWEKPDFEVTYFEARREARRELQLQAAS